MLNVNCSTGARTHALHSHKDRQSVEEILVNLFAISWGVFTMYDPTPPPRVPVRACAFREECRAKDVK